MKCPYCGGQMVLKEAFEVYHTRASKKYSKVWVCEHFPSCDSYVSCHPNTEIPEGRPANARLRTLKREAHRQFDPIWKSELMSRKEAYKWLADMLEIPFSECHIGMFDIKMCQKTIHLCARQNNERIRKYRKEHYGYEQEPPKFTRGYNRVRYRD